MRSTPALVIAGMTVVAISVANIATALTLQQRTAIAQSVGTIAALVGGTPRMGSCIVVSDEGFVATSLQLLHGATGANVVFRDGSKHEVAGFVAVR